MNCLILYVLNNLRTATLNKKYLFNIIKVVIAKSDVKD